MELIVLIVAVSVAGSFLCSLSEAALYSIPLGRIETLRRHGSAGGQRLAALRQNVDRPIAAILALNTIFNAMGGVWAGALVEARYGHEALMPFSLAYVTAILILSEITPKSLGVRFANSLAPVIALPLQVAVWALHPYILVAEAVSGLFGKSGRFASPTEEDLVSAALLSLAGGTILPQEAKWLRNALRLNDITTGEIMTPSSKIRRIPEKLTLGMTKVDAAHWRFKRILVCMNAAPDAIIGVVYRQKVFRAKMEMPPETTMIDLMQPVRFIREDLPVNELLNVFLRNKTQIAVVLSKGGNLAGVVTLEDVLEDMIGDEIE